MKNPYLPLPMKIENIIVETEDNNIKGGLFCVACKKVCACKVCISRFQNDKCPLCRAEKSNLRLISGHPHQAQAAAPSPAAPVVQDGWECETCTFLNPNTNNQCEMCQTDKPREAAATLMCTLCLENPICPESSQEVPMCTNCMQQYR